ncbi:MAG TPA: ABC transporter substrate-binding protein [Candidatus Atribacteria bacterium]|nr:ABC transporter substrate-binding protein [Candidatus Atribacteria bacterium]
MKTKVIKGTLALLLVLILAITAVGCKKSTVSPTPTPSQSAGQDDVADVPANRYDATKTPRTGNNATMPLVLSTGTLDGKFSPFFATSAYDVDVVGMTQIGLLYYNKDGAPEAGINVPSLALEYKQEVSADKSKTTYTFVLKKGITFSDGKPVTAKDVLFSMYVLSDPMYDGSSTFYTMKIQGINEYRLQTSADVLKMVDAILEAGITTGDDGSMVINPANGATKEQQEKFWSYLDAAGQKFAQEIVDYCLANYSKYIGSDYFPGFTADQVNADTDLQVAFGMCLWGFGEVADGVLTDNMGNTYDLSKDTVDAKVYWDNILDAYGYDLSDSGINTEKAGDLTIQDYIKSEYITNEGQVEGGVKSISGITTGTVKGDDGVEREYVQVVIDGVDPTAIFKLGVSVVPMHYYTEGYTGTLNDFGVDTGKKEFMDHLKTKNNKPVGAGPYIFQEYKDNVVTYTAFDNFMLGSPKIKTLRYQEITLGAELDSVLTGTVHFTDPSASMTIINDITKGEGDYAKLAYTLVDNDGYGYIGIQAQAIPEFEVRKALAHAMNVDLAVTDYYGELASVNYRTMTKVLWAYPDNPEDFFPYDGTGEKSKELFLAAGYKYDEAKNIMYYPDGHAKAGQQVTFKFTLPSEAKDHPAGTIFIDTQKVLAKIGVKVEIETDQNLLSKLNTAYESGIQVWAAAWGGGGVDPDMFQIWYSDPKVNQGPPRAGLYYLYENGSEEEKAMLRELNDLIMAGRSTLDIEERKEIYKRALELSTSIAVEIPTYQRKNMFVYNKNVIKSDSLFSGEDVTPFQSPIAFIWNVELND